MWIEGRQEGPCIYERCPVRFPGSFFGRSTIELTHDRETDGSRSFRVYSSRDEEWKAFYLTRTLVPLFFSTDFAPWVLENPFGRMGPAAKTPALLGQGINVKNLRGKGTPIPKPPRGGYPRNLFYIFRSWPIFFFLRTLFFIRWRESQRFLGHETEWNDGKQCRRREKEKVSRCNIRVEIRKKKAQDSRCSGLGV